MAARPSRGSLGNEAVEKHRVCVRACSRRGTAKGICRGQDAEMKERPRTRDTFTLDASVLTARSADSGPAQSPRLASYSATLEDWGVFLSPPFPGTQGKMVLTDKVDRDFSPHERESGPGTLLRGEKAICTVPKTLMSNTKNDQEYKETRELGPSIEGNSGERLRRKSSRRPQIHKAVKGNERISKLRIRKEMKFRN